MITTQRHNKIDLEWIKNVTSWLIQNNNKVCGKRQRERDRQKEKDRHIFALSKKYASINIVASLEIIQLLFVCNAVILFTPAASLVLYFASGPAIFTIFSKPSNIGWSISRSCVSIILHNEGIQSCCTV